jgi:hypothetical protein
MSRVERVCRGVQWTGFLLPLVDCLSLLCSYERVDRVLQLRCNCNSHLKTSLAKPPHTNDGTHARQTSPRPTAARRHAHRSTQHIRSLQLAAVPRAAASGVSA